MGQQRGLARLDFGASDWSQPGLVRYKRKFATEEKAIVWLRWEPEDYASRRDHQVNDVLHHTTHLLTSPGVPDEITRAAGDELYRLFC